jgi:hypothetical protein
MKKNKPGNENKPGNIKIGLRNPERFLRPDVSE